MKLVNVNDTYLSKFNLDMNNQKVQDELKYAFDLLDSKSGAGNDYLGWVDYPLNYDKNEFERIIKAAERIKKTSEVLIVIGIGGSYLGAKASIEALKPNFSKEKGTEVIFAGNSISAPYLLELIEYVKDKDFSINVISKSGTTTEPALAFRVFKKMLEDKYGKGSKEVAKRIYATTDPVKGTLHDLSVECGYEMFTVPSDMGGRYSVLSAVGLLPIAVAGIDIKELLEGAKEAYLENKDYNSEVGKYALIRNLLYRQGKKIELLVGYEPQLLYLNEWWKQLFGESEGKDHKGLFPASVIFSTDLHSMGQYIQDGERHLFETVINIKNPKYDLKIEPLEVDLDNLNYLAGKTVDYVNKQAMLATVLAHTDGDVPNVVLELDKLDARNLGYLFYFFEKACAISGYLLGVNPFNQPGVEAYKKNMFALLGKPGYEAQTEELRKKLNK